MPEEKKTYIVDNTPVDVDVVDVEGFLQANPNAQEAKSFVVDNDTVDVLMADVEGFLSSVPNAKPLFQSEPQGKAQKAQSGVMSMLGKQSAESLQKAPSGSAMKARGVESQLPSTLTGEEVKQEIETRVTGASLAGIDYEKAASILGNGNINQLQKFGNYENKQSYFAKVDEAKRKIVNQKDSNFSLPNNEQGKQIYLDATNPQVYKKLQRESDEAIKNMMGELNPIIEKEIDTSFLKENEDGFLVPNPEKIDEYSRNLSTKYGLPDDGFFKEVVYNKASSVASFKEIEPVISKEFNSLIRNDNELKSIYKELEKGFTTKGIEEEKYLSEVGRLGERISDESNLASKGVTENVSSMSKNMDAEFTAYQQDVNSKIAQLNNEVEQGLIPRQEYESIYQSIKEEYENAYNKYESQRLSLFDAAQQELNSINTKYNQRFRRQQRELANIADQNVKKAWDKYSKEINESPELKKRFEELYGSAYKKVITEKSNKVLGYNEARSYQLMQKYGNNSFGGIAAFADRFFRSTDNAAGASLEALGGAFGIDGIKDYGRYLQSLYTLPQTRTSEFSDLFDPMNLAQLSGDLTGAMMPTIAASAMVASATKSASATTQLAATSLASFFVESADIAQRSHDDMFEKTNSVAKANEAAEKSWSSQFAIMPLYAFSGLPFIKSPFSRMSLPFRIATGASAELLEELPQELLQNISEENISEGKNPFDDVLDKISDNDFKRLKETFISVAPVSILGGVGQLNSKREKSKKEQLESEISSFAAKAKVNEIIGDLSNQWISQMVKRKGSDFSTSVVNTLFAEGTIDEQTKKDLLTKLEYSKKSFEDSKQLGLNDSESVVYDAIVQDVEKKTVQLEQAKASGNTVLEGILSNEISGLKAMATNFVQNKQGDFYVFTFEDGSSKVITNSNWSTDKAIIDLIKNNKLNVSAYSENGQSVLDNISKDNNISPEGKTTTNEQIALKKEQDAKDAELEIKERRDKEIEQIAAIRPDLTDDDILLADLPESVSSVMDRMDASIPTDVVAVDEAIGVLDEKFAELEAYKKNPRRTHTTAQIDEVVGLLDAAKRELQFYKEAIIDDEKGINQRAQVEGIAKTKANEATSKPKEETVESIRAQELDEFMAEVPNAESFITEGKIDKELIDASDNAKAKEIYDKYDKLITPLLTKNQKTDENIQEKPNTKELLENAQEGRNENEGRQDSEQLRSEEQVKSAEPKAESGASIPALESVESKPTFEKVPILTRTAEEIETAKNEVFNNLNKLELGSVIENSDGEIKVVTEKSTDKRGNQLIGVVTYERQADGSLRQMTNIVWSSKSADGKIRLDYNPHSTGTNSKGERVTVTDQITGKKIDLLKENIFTADENGNLIQINKAPQVKGSTEQKSESGAIPALEVYHGTPHGFEKFDISKLGSGEGAQVFGHGLYFTNDKGIAEGYANKLSSKKNFWQHLMDGNDISMSKEDFAFVKKELDALGFDGAKAENENLGNIKVDGKNEFAPDVLDALSVLFGKNAKTELEGYDLSPKEIERMLDIKKKISNPKLYTAEVKNGDYMDWVSPLSDAQKKKLPEINTDGTGEQIYKELSKKLGSDKKASEYLESKGIDGIIYKTDKGTGGKEGTGRNYVVFNQDNISVKEINGEAQPQPKVKSTEQKSEQLLTNKNQENEKPSKEANGEEVLEGVRETGNENQGRQDSEQLRSEEQVQEVETNTTEDATKEGEVEQDNQQQREGVVEQQQGEQEDRQDQESVITQAETETGGSDSVTQGEQVIDVKKVEASFNDLLNGKTLNEVVLSNELNDDETNLLIRKIAESDKLPKKQFNKKDKIGNDFDINDDIDVKPIDKKRKIPKSKIEALSNIVSDDELRPAMTGVYKDAENKKLVATDAFKLVVINDNTVKKSEIVDIKTGRVIDARYPDYNAVIPKDNPIKRKINVDDILPQLNGLSQTKRFFDKPILARIQIGDIDFYFNPDVLLDALSVFYDNNISEVEIQLSQPNRALVIESNKGIMALVMPIMASDNLNLGAKTIHQSELTIAEKNGQVQVDIDYLQRRRDEAQKKYSESISEFRNAKPENARSLEFDVEYNKKRLDEIDAQIGEKKSLLIDNPIQEQEDLVTVKNAIENGEITQEQVSKYIDQEVERSGEVEQSIEAIESKAESESQIENKEALDEINKTIQGEQDPLARLEAIGAELQKAVESQVNPESASSKANKIAATTIEQGGKVVDAIQKAVDYIRNNEQYKALTNLQKRAFETDFVAELSKVFNSEIDGENRISKFGNRVLESMKAEGVFPKSLIDKMKPEYESRRQEDVREVANKIMSILSDAEVKALAESSQINGDLKTSLYGALYGKAKQAYLDNPTPQTEAAFIVAKEDLQLWATNAGQAVAMFKDVYEQYPELKVDDFVKDVNTMAQSSVGSENNPYSTAAKAKDIAPKVKIRRGEIFQDIASVLSGEMDAVKFFDKTSKSFLSNKKVRNALRVLTSFGQRINPEQKDFFNEVIARIKEQGKGEILNNKQQARELIESNLKDINGRIKTPLSDSQVQDVTEAFLDLYEYLGEQEIAKIVDKAFGTKRNSFSGQKNSQVAKLILYGTLDTEDLRNKFAIKYNIPYIGDAEAAELSRLAENVNNSNGGAKKNAQAQLDDYIKKLKTGTTFKGRFRNRFNQAAGDMASYIINNILMNPLTIALAGGSNILRVSAKVAEKIVTGRWSDLRYAFDRKMDFTITLPDGTELKTRLNPILDGTLAAFAGIPRLSEYRLQGVSRQEQKIRDAKTRRERVFRRLFGVASSRTYSAIDASVTPIFSAMTDYSVTKDILKMMYKDVGVEVDKATLAQDVEALIGFDSSNITDIALQAYQDVLSSPLYNDFVSKGMYDPANGFPTSASRKRPNSVEAQLYNEYMTRIYEIHQEGFNQRFEELRGRLNSFGEFAFDKAKDYNPYLKDRDRFIARNTNEIAFFGRPQGTAGEMADLTAKLSNVIPALKYVGVFPLFNNAMWNAAAYVVKMTPFLNALQLAKYKGLKKRGFKQEFETDLFVKIDQKNMATSVVVTTTLMAGIVGWLASLYDTPEEEKEAWTKGRATGLVDNLTPGQRNTLRDANGQKLKDGWLYKDGYPMFNYKATPYFGMFNAAAYSHNKDIFSRDYRENEIFVEDNMEFNQALAGYFFNSIYTAINTTSTKQMVEMVEAVVGIEPNQTAEGLDTRSVREIEKKFANLTTNLIPYGRFQKSILNAIRSGDQENVQKIANSFLDRVMLGNAFTDHLVKSNLTDPFGRPIEEQLTTNGLLLGLNTFTVTGGEVNSFIDTNYKDDPYMQTHIKRNYGVMARHNIVSMVEVLESGQPVTKSEAKNIETELEAKGFEVKKSDLITNSSGNQVIESIRYIKRYDDATINQVNEMMGKKIYDLFTTLKNLENLNSKSNMTNADYKKLMNRTYSYARDLSLYEMNKAELGGYYKDALERRYNTLKGEFNKFNLTSPESFEIN